MNETKRLRAQGGVIGHRCWLKCKNGGTGACYWRAWHIGFSTTRRLVTRPPGFLTRYLERKSAERFFPKTADTENARQSRPLPCLCRRAPMGRRHASADRLSYCGENCSASHHRGNRLPAEVWVESLEDALRLIGRQRDATVFQQLYVLTRDQLPELFLGCLPIRSKCWVWLPTGKITGVCALAPESSESGNFLAASLYPGTELQVCRKSPGNAQCVTGSVVTAGSNCQEFTGVKQFAERYGFRTKPQRIRFRLLDSRLGIGLGFSEDVDQDLTLSIRDFANLSTLPNLMDRLEQVFITENEINFLAFPAVVNSLVIFGSGYGFEAYSQISWLQHLPCYYWGTSTPRVRHTQSTEARFAPRAKPADGRSHPVGPF